MPDTERIRNLNDAFRTTLVGGNILLTPGVGSLPEGERAELLDQIRSFRDFDRDNDPHHEHDFGAIQLGATTYFFKIDYYDQSLEMGSPDPANPAVTKRVLAIMRADEY